MAERLYHKLEAGDVDGGGSFYGAVTYQSALGRIKQTIGDPEEANAILRNSLAKEVAILERETGNPEAAYRVAAVEASLGLTDSAVGHLRQAVALGWIDYRSLKLDPRFDSLRSDPEFEVIIDEVCDKVARMRATLEIDSLTSNGGQVRSQTEFGHERRL